MNITIYIHNNHCITEKAEKGEVKSKVNTVGGLKNC